MPLTLNSPPKRFLWHLYLWYVLVTIASLFAITFYTSGIMRDRFLQQSQSDLAEIAIVINEAITPDMQDSIALQNKVKLIGQQGRLRITVFHLDGQVIADSEHDPSTMSNHADSPEIKEAIAGHQSKSIRYSDTLGKELMYVVIPVTTQGKLGHIIRVSKPIAQVFDFVSPTNHRFMISAALIALIAALLSYLAYRKTVVPLHELKKAAVQFSKGEFGYRLYTNESRDMKELFEVMNQMATQLDSRIKTISQQANEQETVLESMIEGVMAVSTQGKVLKTNSAMLGFLGNRNVNYKGRSVPEIVRSAELQNFINKSLHSAEPLEEELYLIGSKERTVRAYTRSLNDVEGVKLGVLVILHDVTSLKKLENIRKDFVANVSHELRTPITSIKGSIDALLEGAIDEDPQAAKRFLEIIARHSDRLIKIVDDLLSLARIEAGEAASSVVFEALEISSVISAAIEITAQKASDKFISLVVTDSTQDLKVMGNEVLLEQAIVNLITNAIEYSESADQILIRYIADHDQISIEVQDFGCGIPSAHIPRLFERFYRVDRARSRKSGGTGLGLAIVKHIAQLHKGNVSVTSVLGKGSTFSLKIPINP